MTPGQPSDVNLVQVVFGLLGGLSLFMFGMGQMSDALRAVAGDGMRVLLARLTTNRVMGAITGAFVTAVVQSSSVTTVLLVGFISAGLITLSQSVGVIMGANIGSTVTAQLIAFKLTNAAFALAADTPRQIADAHTVLNIANGILLLAFTGMFARFIA